MDTGTLAVALSLGIPFVAVLGHFSVKLIKTWRDRPERDPKSDLEELELLEEMSRELDRMESRISALETILQDRQRKDR